MNPITYSLKSQNKNFYKDLEVFTDKILAELNCYFKLDIINYSNFLKAEGLGSDSQVEEYMVEFVSMGVFQNKYASYAQSTSNWATDSLYALYKIRKSSKKLKPYIDNLRGFLSAHFLFVRNKYTVEYTSSTFAKLVKWLKATGEFNEEATRLTNWAFYLSTLESEEASAILSKAASFAYYFEEQALLYLGAYTKNVKYFLNNEHQNYKYREDYLFAGRSEEEYHLNMFGAEVLNRVLKPKFDRTKNKVLLLPTCMSNPTDGQCKAKQDGFRLVCSHCTKKCEVSKTMYEMELKGVSTYLIPHSSGFSKTLKHWQNQDETGLIGVACVLNLLTGGYEMQKLNISSQCVFLDYAGCKKHWHKTGISTSINIDKLSMIVNNNQVVLPKNKRELTIVNNEIKVA